MAVQVGVIGAGGISPYHINGYRAAGASVVAICDIDAVRAEWMAKEHSIPRFYTTHEKMLASEKSMTAVSVCTPNRFHAPIAIAAAQAGRHVFCEKPPALSAVEATQMADAAKTAGVYLMYDFNNRARPESLAMKRYIDGGAVGRINSAQAAWVRRCGIPGYGGWFTQKSISGGGPTIDLLHMLDLALWFMGYPEAAWVSAGVFTDFAHDPTYGGPWGMPSDSGGTMDVETAAHAMILFKTGQVLYTRASWAEMVEREEVSVSFQGSKAGGRVCRLFGSDGLDSSSEDFCQLYTHDNGVPANREVLVRADASMGRLNAVMNFVQTIEGKAKALSTPDEGVALMRIIEAIYRSGEAKAPVEVARG